MLQFGVGVVALLIVAGAACQKKTNTPPQDGNDVVINENANTVVPSLSNARVDTSGNTNAPVTTNSNLNVNTNRTTSTNTTNDTIAVERPEPYDRLISPFTVSGTTSDSNVFVRVKNAAGGSLITEPASVNGTNFSLTLSFEFSGTAAGTVEVYTKDSSEREENLISMPVTFAIPSALPDPIGTLPTFDNTNSATNNNVNAGIQNSNSAIY